MKSYLFVIIVIFHITTFAKRQPDVIIELCRHGARAPMQTTYDPTWPETEIGQLIPAGMRQHYILGQELLETYPDILGQPFNWENVFILSDLCNRTIQSASAQLYGIYQGRGPGLGSNFNEEIAVPPYNEAEATEIISGLTDSAALPYNYYPFVIPVVDLSNFTQGTLFGTLGFETCVNMETWIEENMEDQNAQQSWAIFNETITNLNNYATSPLTNGLEVTAFADTAYSNIMAGKPLPGGMPANDSQLLSNMTFAYSWWMTYLFMGQEVENYVGAYELVTTILSFVEGAINGTNSNNFMLLSGHDGNVAAVLGALGMLSAEQVMANFNASVANMSQPYPSAYWPPYASSLIFELYNTTNPYLRVTYNGEALPLCDGETECEWSQFEWIMMNGIGNYTLADVDNACGYNPTTVQLNLPSTPSSFADIGYMAAIILLIVALGIAIGKIVSDGKKHKQEVARVRSALLSSEKNIL